MLQTSDEYKKRLEDVRETCGDMVHDIAKSAVTALENCENIDYETQLIRNYDSEYTEEVRKAVDNIWVCIFG